MWLFKLNTDSEEIDDMELTDSWIRFIMRCFFAIMEDLMKYKIVIEKNA